jgi:hypothetical protein
MKDDKYFFHWYCQTASVQPTIRLGVKYTALLLNSSTHLGKQLYDAVLKRGDALSPVGLRVVKKDGRVKRRKGTKGRAVDGRKDREITRK